MCLMERQGTDSCSVCCVQREVTDVTVRQLVDVQMCRIILGGINASGAATHSLAVPVA